MSDLWAASIDLPAGFHDTLASFLGRLDVRALKTSWPELAEKHGLTAPLLVVASFDSFAGETDLSADARSVNLVLVAPRAPTSETLQCQIDHGPLNVFPEALWSDRECLERTLRGLLYPREMFDIRNRIGRISMHERFAVASLAEKHLVAQQAADLVLRVAGTQRRARSVHLIINELVNNAFFHSFRSPEGDRKYSPARFSRLCEGESVVLEVAASENTIALAVEDNSGTLNPTEVVAYLQRQISGEGLYDSHGRGFYLVSQLVDHLDICLAPGRCSHIVAITHVGRAEPLGMLTFFLAGEENAHNEQRRPRP